MRHFGPVTESKICDNPVCDKIVPVSDNDYYTSQTVVTYTGSDLAFTYCSNRCVNADADRSSEAAENQNHYWAHVLATYENEERNTHCAVIEAAHHDALMENAYRYCRVYGMGKR